MTRSTRARTKVSLYTDHIYPPLLQLVSRHFDEQRRELMAHATGRVLELGVGTGSNLGFYPPVVTDVVGIDPHGAVLDRAHQAVEALESEGGLAYRIRLHRADAAQLPYADASFDTVVAFLTLCTIPHYVAAARETHRVLKAGGRLLVLEHVKADTAVLERVQRALNPVWNRLAVGCHLDRDTASVLAEAGFDTSPLDRYRDDAFFPPTAPRIRGVLEKAAGPEP